MDPYTYLIIGMDGPCATILKGSNVAAAGVPLYTGTKYISGMRNAIFDYYPDHLYVHDIFDADFANNEYRAGRYITSIIGVF